MLVGQAAAPVSALSASNVGRGRRMRRQLFSGGIAVSSVNALLTLSVVAFGAATQLPMQSEALLGGLLLAGFDPVPLVLVASLGNVAGSGLNWWLGTQVDRFQGRRWFPVSPAQPEQARQRYQRCGRAALLSAWLPIVGDSLTLVAGMLRERCSVFLAFVAVGKVGRYVLLAWTMAAVGPR